MGIIGSREMIILLIIVLIIFGPTKLPQLARAIGKSMRELKDGLTDTGSDSKRAHEDKEWERKHAATQSEAQPVPRNEEKAKGV